MSDECACSCSRDIDPQYIQLGHYSKQIIMIPRKKDTNSHACRNYGNTHTRSHPRMRARPHKSMLARTTHAHIHTHARTYTFIHTAPAPTHSMASCHGQEQRGEIILCRNNDCILYKCGRQVNHARHSLLVVTCSGGVNQVRAPCNDVVPEKQHALSLEEPIASQEQPSDTE